MTPYERLMIRSELHRAARAFPLLERRMARRQAKKLIRAKRWMQERGITACAIGSKFEYKVATGSVLK